MPSRPLTLIPDDKHIEVVGVKALTIKPIYTSGCAFAQNRPHVVVADVWTPDVKLLGALSTSVSP